MLGDEHNSVVALLLVRNSITHRIRWLVGPQALSGRFGEEKNFLRPPGFELRTRSGCTDRANEAPLLLMQRKIFCVWCKLQYIQQICFAGLFMATIKMSLLIIVDHIEHSRLYMFVCLFS